MSLLLCRSTNRGAAVLVADGREVAPDVGVGVLTGTSALIGLEPNQ